jgi:fructokinase
VTIVTEKDSTDVPLHGQLPVVDTTGAGDATMAAMVHQLALHGLPSDHDGWVAMTQNALVVAAIVSSQRGAALSMPTKQQAEEAGARF